MKNYYGLPRSNQKSGRARLYLFTAALVLGLGLAFASSAHGATLAQTGGGKISGSAVVGNAGAPGITVELRQRTNSGADTLLATTTTDPSGNYSFAGQPSAPGDAFFYIRFSGGKGTLASWYTWPIIYLTGSDFSVPAVDLADVPLVEPASGSDIAPGGAIKWKARKAGETYRLFIYAQGKTDKAVLDSGSLGSSTEYTLSEGSLGEGKYEGVVQIRDAVLGYGQSQAHFLFTLAKAKSADSVAPQAQPQQGAPKPEPTAPGSALAPATQQPAEENAPAQSQPLLKPTAVQPSGEQTPAAPPPASDQPTAPSAASTKPDVKLHLSADKLSVDQGKPLVYSIEIRNDGDGAASNVVVTDKLPASVSVNSSQTKSTLGAVAVEGNVVTVQVGELAPNSSAKVEIPVSVNGTAVNNVSNQASAVYKEAPEPVQSNAFVSQVAEPLTGPPATQPQQPTDSQPQQPAAQPPASGPAAPQDSQPSSPRGSQPAAAPKAPPASQPHQPDASPPKSVPKAPVTAPSTAPATKATQSPKAQAKAPAAPMPQTGGSFPLVLAVLLLAVTLVARYLRGMRFRRS